MLCAQVLLAITNRRRSSYKGWRATKRCMCPEHSQPRAVRVCAYQACTASHPPSVLDSCTFVVKKESLRFASKKKDLKCACIQQRYVCVQKVSSLPHQTHERARASMLAGKAYIWPQSLLGRSHWLSLALTGSN
eukprot:48151-Chlamydomonas_euryale.AAC.3